MDEDKSVQAYLKGRRHLVIFDEVDVFLPVERALGGTHAAIPYIIRRANHKPLLDIHREIRAFQTRPIPPGQGMPAAFLFMMAALWPLPRLGIRLIRVAGRRDPTRLVSAAGTVGVTALGMAGRGGGWGLAPAGQSLLLVVGGITPQVRCHRRARRSRGTSSTSPSHSTMTSWMAPRRRGSCTG